MKCDVKIASSEEDRWLNDRDEINLQYVQTKKTRKNRSLNKQN